MNKFVWPFISLALSLLFGGCATIVKDDNQPVAFSSDPQGAIVSINGVPRGTTPVTIMIERSRKKQMLEVTKDGYISVQMPLEKHIAGMTFGNIIFGGIIGLGVDYATGKGANYQDSVMIKLIPLPKVAPEAAATTDSSQTVPSARRIVTNNGLGLTVAVDEKKVLVKSVQNDSAATAAGIAAGDEIVGFTDDTEGKGLEDIANAINKPKGKTAVVSWRSGTSQVVTAKLDW